MQKKRCSRCQQEKCLKCFSKSAKNSDGLSYVCKECHKKYLREHYAANKSYYVEKANVRKEWVLEELHNLILDHLETHPCVDCGETDPEVLTYDHVRGVKKDSVANLVRCGYKWTTIKKEIDKCDVRCWNCHIRRTRNSLGWRSKQRRPSGVDMPPS